MKNITLKDRVVEPIDGRIKDTAPMLFERYKSGEGTILSTLNIRRLEIENFENAPQLADNYWTTLTLSATKYYTIKIILPYENEGRGLTNAAGFGFGLINNDETLIRNGVNLNIKNRWEELNGREVYVRKRNKWFESENGKLIGLNNDMTLKEALNCPLLLTKLRHPHYVNPEFARTADEVNEIINETFRLGQKKYGHNKMMGQYFLNICDDAILKTWQVYSIKDWGWSSAMAYLDVFCGRFAFDNLNDA